MSKRSIIKLLCILGLLVWVGTAQAQVDKNPPGSVNIELAIVDVDLLNNIILITLPKDLTEKIEIQKEGKELDHLLSKDKQMLAVFQRLYDEGWVIESELMQTHGRVIYIMKREKQ
jgi:hypothetical protein